MRVIMLILIVLISGVFTGGWVWLGAIIWGVYACAVNGWLFFKKKGNIR